MSEQSSTQEPRPQRLLLHTVEARLAGKPVREYRLLSGTTADGWRRLDRLQLCAWDERGEARECLAAMDFDWIDTDHPGVYKTCLSGVADPLGAATAFGYGTLRAGGAHPFLFDERPFGAFAAPADVRPHPAEADGTIKPVVATLWRDDGAGGMRRLDYAYFGRPYDGRRSWGFFGFAATRVVDRQSGIATYRQFRLDLPHAARLAAEHVDLGGGQHLFRFHDHPEDWQERVDDMDDLCARLPGVFGVHEVRRLVAKGVKTFAELHDILRPWR